jgi:hypothetical protein
VRNPIVALPPIFNPEPTSLLFLSLPEFIQPKTKLDDWSFQPSAEIPYVFHWWR